MIACRVPNSVYIEVDLNGSLSLMNHPELTENLLMIPREKLNSFDKVKGLAGDIRRGGLPDRTTFILDTGTALANMRLREIVKSFGDKRPENMAYMQDYKQLTAEMYALFIEWCELERNIIILAHDVDERDDSDGSFITRPQFSPKLESFAQEIFDGVYHMTASVSVRGEQTTRKIRAMPTRRIKAKTRLGVPAEFPADELWNHVKLPTN